MLIRILCTFMHLSAAFLGILGVAGAAGPVPPPPPLVPGARCPVTVQYNVNLGQGQDTALVPIFVATVTLTNNQAPRPTTTAAADNGTISAWRMGWRFPYGSTIKGPQDVFDPRVALLTPDSQTAVLQSAAGGDGGVDGANPTLSGPLTIAPGQTVQFGFLGTKGSAAPTPSNPYNVGPIAGLAFNNLPCVLVPITAPGAAPTLPANVTTSPTGLEVEYTPIQYENRPLAGPTTQFLVRLRNAGNDTAVALPSVSLQYWFEGPVSDGAMAADSAPGEFFKARCDWASLGCAAVALGIARGVADVPGARFTLNVSFIDAAGALLPTGAAAPASVFLGQGTDGVDILLTLTTAAGVAVMDPTQDYSYLETPLLALNGSAGGGSGGAAAGGTNGTLVPRRAMLNPRIPAFVDATIAWGIPPAPAAAPGAEMVVIAATGAGAPGQAAALPEGVFCEAIRGGSQQSCTLQAVYCCSGPDPVTKSIPEVWPPPGTLQPAPAEEASPPGQEPIVLPLPPPTEQQLAGAPAPGTQKKSGGGSVAWVAGIAVGLVAGGLVAGGTYLGWRRRRIRHQRIYEAELEAGSGVKVTAAPAPLSPKKRADSSAGASPSSPPTASFHMRQISDASSQHSASAVFGYVHHRSVSGGGALLEKSGLWRHPSGVSSVADPTGVLEGTALDSSGGGGGGTMPRSPFEIVAAAAGLSTSTEDPPGSAREESSSTLPPNVLALLERKARTAPGALLCAAAAAAARITASVVSSPDSSDDDDEGSSVMDPPLPWRLRRSASWAGVLQDPMASESFWQAARLARRRSQLPGPLPPLAPLPPPIFPGSAGPAPDVDLDVDPAELEGRLGRCLGTGGFGAVYEAEWRGKHVAVKILPPLAEMALEGGGGGAAAAAAARAALLREIQLASKFRSDRLVKVYGACTRDERRACLIMELAEGGSLFHRIHDRHKRRLSYLEILQMAHDVAEGLAYLHPSVVHRDLKPQNVLLDGDGRAKLADFGISRVKRDPMKSCLSSQLSAAENGTPMYMAPEAFVGGRIDEKVDVFALGVILNEAWTRRQPWRDSAHLFQIVLRVAINGERPWMDPDCPEALRRLITKCWHQDPRERPSCAELLRLTDLLMGEELRQWEGLGRQGSGAAVPGR